MKWKTSWSNLKLTKSVSAHEKYFQWQVQQDMLPVGSRLHRPGAEKRCLTVLENNEECKQLRDLVHALLACPCIAESSSSLRDILADFLGCTVTDA